MSAQPSPVLTSLTPTSIGTETSRIQFLIKAALSGLRVSIPVKVLAVTNDGELSPIGTLNVQPMVSAVDGNGTAIPHGTIYNVPYMRIQGGSNGIILDPEVGDIGIATVCDRDISTVKNSNDISAPGSSRKFDMSDMVYLMTIIGAAPTQYIQFNSSGLTILSPTKVTINAPNVEIDASTACHINAPSIVLNGAVSQGAGSYGGNATLGGSLTVIGDVTAEGTSLHTHKHGGVQTGGGQTGVPV
jgi:hypothetical protein